MFTQNGFIKAHTHEKTTDLSMLDKIVYEKRNANQMVEDELNEFRKEIEAKFEVSEAKNYVMKRCSPSQSRELLANQLVPDSVGQICSRITLQHEGDNEYALNQA